jgi:hypothetical protein
LFKRKEKAVVYEGMGGGNDNNVNAGELANDFLQADDFAI